MKTNVWFRKPDVIEKAMLALAHFAQTSETPFAKLRSVLESAHLPLDVEVFVNGVKWSEYEEFETTVKHTSLSYIWFPTKEQIEVIEEEEGSEVRVLPPDAESFCHTEDTFGEDDEVKADNARVETQKDDASRDVREKFWAEYTSESNMDGLQDAEDEAEYKAEEDAMEDILPDDISKSKLFLSQIHPIVQEMSNEYSSLGVVWSAEAVEQLMDFVGPSVSNVVQLIREAGENLHADGVALCDSVAEDEYIVKELRDVQKTFKIAMRGSS